MKKFLIFVLIGITNLSGLFAVRFYNENCFLADIGFAGSFSNSDIDFETLSDISESSLCEAIEMYSTEGKETATIQRLEVLPKNIKGVLDDGLDQFNARVDDLYGVVFFLRHAIFNFLPDDTLYIAFVKVTNTYRSDYKATVFKISPYTSISDINKMMESTEEIAATKREEFLESKNKKTLKSKAKDWYEQLKDKLGVK